MKNLNELLRNGKKASSTVKPEGWNEQDDEEHERTRCDWYNRSQDKPTSEIKCMKCRDKGDYQVREKDSMGIMRTVMYICGCQEGVIADSKIRSRNLQESTWQAFKTDKPHHRDMRDKAETYISNMKGKWFYLGGQVGSGKTHLAKTMERYLIETGHDVLFIKWRDKINEIKSDYEKSKSVVSRLQKVHVLIIDDFLKGEPTDADITRAFEIIDARYEKNLPTIITTQHNHVQLMKYDEALASRIVERTKQYGYLVNIQKDDQKNFRLR